ncbi:MAG: dynamin family protein, partial [Pirellulaceae bacterium]
MQSSQYQACREQLLQHIDELRSIRDHLVSSDPLFVNSLPVEARHKMLYLDREATRLRNPDLTVAFVGGFSAGKSSLVNAFLGRYLLPESAKVTTAVPTFVRATEADEVAELHYLNEAEVDALGELYRRELAELLGDPRLAKLPFAEILERAKPLSQEGRGRRLVDQFERFHEHRRRRQFDARGKVVNCSIIEAQDKIRDETEAMFLDRISLHVRAEDLPADVVLVDLPGVSVPNPRHREVTFRFVREEAHAVVFVVMATRLFDKDEVEIMELFRKGESHIADKTFWVLNRWDSLSPQQQRQTLADFESKMQ